MAVDVIQANYDQLESIASCFGQQTDNNTALLGRLNQTVEQLRSGGWEGRAADAFFAEMDGEIFPAMQRLTTALEQAQAVTLKAKVVIRQAEEEAAGLFGGEGSPGSMGVGVGMGAGDGGGSWGGGGTESNFFTTDKMGHVDGTVIEKEGFYLKESEIRANLFQAEGGFGDSVYREQFGDFTVSALGYEAGASAQIGFNDDGLFGSVEAGAAVYAGQVEYNAELAGAEITLEAMAGASVQVQGEMEIDLAEGEVELEGEVGAFAGVTAEGRAHKDIGPAELAVTGEVGAGIGFNASGEIEFEDGKLNVEGNIGAFLGVGAGVGFDVEIDIPEAVDTVVDIGEEAVDLGGEILDSIFG